MSMWVKKKHKTIHTDPYSGGERSRRKTKMDAREPLVKKIVRCIIVLMFLIMHWLLIIVLHYYSPQPVQGTSYDHGIHHTHHTPPAPKVVPSTSHYCAAVVTPPTTSIITYQLLPIPFPSGTLPALSQGPPFCLQNTYTPFSNRPPEAPLEVSPENSGFESPKVAKCQSKYCGFGRVWGWECHILEIWLSPTLKTSRHLQCHLQSCIAISLYARKVIFL